MSADKFNSEIDLKLPIVPLTNDSDLKYQLQIVYSALQILQTALSDINTRLLALENPP